MKIPVTWMPKPPPDPATLPNCADCGEKIESRPHVVGTSSKREICSKCWVMPR